MSHPPLIWDEFHAQRMPPESMDVLWAEGWRHFGTHFYRYNLMVCDGKVQTVVPLRVELAQLRLTKSQRRVLRRNEDLTVVIEPAAITDEVRAMFQRHKTRFSDNVPDDLSVFLSAEPATVPCPCHQIRCLLGGECIAISFFDAGASGISSVYAMFEPAFASRSLGLFTMLKEMEWARAQAKPFAYPGYATLGRSHYDYKKQFCGLQGYDWTGSCWLPWTDFADQPSASP